MERVFLGLAAALALATAARLPAAWESGNALNHVSGAWMTLADDLARGTFYRPLHTSGLGYGGTRFFPLVFALHAALLKAGVPLLAAGYALSAAAAALTVLAAYAFLRAVGLPRPRAAAFAALAIAGFAGQLGASAARGDLLPVALSALGLAAVVAGARRAAPSPSPRRAARGAGARERGAAVPWLPAVLFALAFAAKPTALTAPAAAAAWLVLRREPRRALALAGATGALAAGALVAIDALSGGRFRALLAACALGGAGAGDLLRAPLRLAWLLVREDPSGLVLLLGAAAALAASGGARRHAPHARPAGEPAALAALWLATATAGQLAVFASPGTGANHLVEVEVAAAVALGAATTLGARAARVARLAAPVAAAAGVALAVAILRDDLSSSRLLEARAIARKWPDGPILSEDPLVPLVAGERPVLLDPWMFRLASRTDPALARGLAAEIARGAYPAIVLFRDLADPASDAWFAQGNLGLDVVAEIRRTCRRAGGIGRYHVYVPVAAEPAAPERGAARVTTLGDAARLGAGAPTR